MNNHQNITTSQPLFVEQEAGHYLIANPITLEQICSITSDLLAQHFQYGEGLTSSAITVQYLQSKLAMKEHEVFSCIFLNSQHQVLACEDLFTGTIDSTSVYPREVVKRVLHHNAAAVILSHNHPSGVPEPSQADQTITKRLQEALKLIDVRVLDHLVIGGADTVSFAERGLL
jgi:DNA repair protein RadC